MDRGDLPVRGEPIDLMERLRNHPETPTEECKRCIWHRQEPRRTEWFRFMVLGFNVTKAEELSKNIKTVIVPIEKVRAALSFTGVDGGHVPHVDMTKPLLVAELPPSLVNKLEGAAQAMMIDGHHRLQGHVNQGNAEVPVRYIPWRMTKQFLDEGPLKYKKTPPMKVTFGPVKACITFDSAPATPKEREAILDLGTHVVEVFTTPNGTDVWVQAETPRTLASLTDAMKKQVPKLLRRTWEPEPKEDV
jgi:hypothetical protein